MFSQESQESWLYIYKAAHTWEDQADGGGIIAGEVQLAGAEEDQVGHHTVVSKALTQLCAQNAQHYTQLPWAQLRYRLQKQKHKNIK